MKRKRYTPPEKPHELDILKMLTPPAQYEAIIAGMMGEEGDHFIAIIDRLHATWQAMPKTYESTAKGRAALAHVRANHDIEGEARAIVEVYRKLLT